MFSTECSIILGTTLKAPDTSEKLDEAIINEREVAVSTAEGSYWNRSGIKFINSKMISHNFYNQFRTITKSM